MPIIVDEVVISVEVTNQQSGEAQQGSPDIDQHQALIAECAERVLDILSRRGER